MVSGFNEEIRPRLPHTPRVRLPVDTIPDRPILVYEYLDQDLLNLVQGQVSVRARKQILKAILEGIADLHDHDIVHLGKHQTCFLGAQQGRIGMRKLLRQRSILTCGYVGAGKYQVI